MDTNTTFNKRSSLRVPAELSLVALSHGKPVPMWTQNISRDGLFLFSETHVRLRDTFEVWIKLDTEAPPLRCFLTAVFVESTPIGYGIGAAISGISTLERARWERYYRSVLAVQGRKLNAELENLTHARHKPSVLVLDNSLPANAIAGLREHGFTVEQRSSSDQLAADLAELRPELVLAELGSDGEDGRFVCQKLSDVGISADCVLLTANATPREFGLGLFVGATLVIAKPCGPELLAVSLKQVLRARREQTCHHHMVQDTVSADHLQAPEREDDELPARISSPHFKPAALGASPYARRTSSPPVHRLAEHRASAN